MHEIRMLKRLLVLIALLLGVYIWLYSYNPGREKTQTPEQVVPVTEINVADISAVALKNEKGAFGLLSDGRGGLSLVPEEGSVSYSLEEMQGFVYLISKMRSLRVITNYSNSADFGMDKPAAILTLMTEDGDKRRYLLGKASDESGGRYLQPEGVDTIYVISAGTAKLLLRGREDFVQRELIPQLSVEDIDRLHEITIAAVNRPERDYTVKNSGEYRFSLERPLVNPLSTERVFSEIILPLTALYPQASAEVPADPFAGGAEYTLEVEIDGRRYTLFMVRKDDENYYIRNAQSPEIYTIPAERLEFLSRDYLELLRGAVYNCNVSRIASVTFDDLIPGESRMLYISGAGDQLQGEIEGRVIPYRELMTFMNGLNSLPLAAEVRALPESLSEPYASITVNKIDGSRDYLEFINAGNERSYLRVNGEVNFRVFDADLKAIGEALQDILSRKPVPVGREGFSG